MQPPDRKAVWLPPDLHREIKTFAVIRGHGVQECVAIAVREYLERQAQQQQPALTAAKAS